MVAELLAVAAQRNLPRIDKTLFFNCFLQPGPNRVASSTLEALQINYPVKRRQALPGEQPVKE